VADRQIDLAWLAEGDKIENKMQDLSRNIDRILRYGGTPSQQTLWKEYYNLLNTALTTVKSAYMPNSQRKKQYLAIYGDASKINESLIRYLVKLSNDKETLTALNATYAKTNKTASIAADAITRWSMASNKLTNNYNLKKW
jgi:hypothetical protein